MRIAPIIEEYPGKLSYGVGNSTSQIVGEALKKRTGTDIVRVLGERGARVLEEPVSAVMTRKVVSCRESDTVSGIMEMMTIGKFRHLPVVEEGKVVGLISIGDIVEKYWRSRFAMTLCQYSFPVIASRHTR
ncbi:CBS domain-containing protein [Lacticaseibacillus rhamnosus]